MSDPSDQRRFGSSGEPSSDPRQGPDPSAGEVVAAVSDAMVAQIAEERDLVREAALAGVTHRNEAVARKVVEDPGAFHTALWLGGMLGLRLLRPPGYLEDPEGDMVIDPPVIDIIPVLFPDATVIMDEMPPPVGVSDGASPSPSTFERADREITERAKARTELADRTNDLVARSLTTALRQVGTDSDAPGFGSFSASRRRVRKGRNPATGEVIHFPAVARLVDVITSVATNRVLSTIAADGEQPIRQAGHGSDTIGASTPNSDQAGPLREAPADAESPPAVADPAPRRPQWVEDRLRNTDREPRTFGHHENRWSLVMAMWSIFDSDAFAANASFTQIEPPHRDDRWDDATVIMDEMPPPVGVSDGASPSPSTFERADRETTERFWRRKGFVPVWPSVSLVTLVAIVGFAGLVIALVWLFGDWGTGSGSIATSGGSVMATSQPEDTSVEAASQDAVGAVSGAVSEAEPGGGTIGTATSISLATPAVGDAVTPPSEPPSTVAAAPDTTTSTTSTTTTKAASTARTVSATITVTHAPQDASGTARPQTDTVCDISAALDDQTTAYQATMNIQCTGDPVGRLGLLAMIISPDGTAVYPIDDISEGPQTFTLTGSEQIDTAGDANVFLHWEMLFGPIDMLANVTASNPDIFCELRNAPMGSGGTHAADCFYGQPPG